MLYVLNTGKDIHLVGRDPLSSPVRGQSYMDPNGYPWALLVPEDWQHPAETQYIGKAYPLFDEWRASKGAVAPYWYLYPASTGSKSGNQPALPVTLHGQPPTGGRFQRRRRTSSSISADPDGDTVQFMSSPAPMALAGSVLSGRPTRAWSPSSPACRRATTCSTSGAWTSTGPATIDKPFKVTFSFRGQASSNNPPSVSFPAWDFLVAGAGTTAVDGGYVEQADLTNGYPWYSLDGGSNALFNFQAVEDNGVRHWGLHSSTIIRVGVSYSEVTYYSPASLTPPETGWATAVGAGAPPTVLRFPISGDTAVGGKLTAQYVFTDPDGDAEGATTFQWYRFATSTATSGGTLVGTNSRNYTSVSADGGMWLRVEVTPVDAIGTAGTPVLSTPAVQVGGGS